MAAAEQEEGNKNAATWELIPTSEQQEPERFLSGTPLVPGYCVKAPVLLPPSKTFIVRKSHKSSSSRFPCSRWSTLPPVVLGGTAVSVPMEKADDHIGRLSTPLGCCSRQDLTFDPHC